MVVFALGIVVGAALGVVIMGFLGVTAYDRGFDAATRRRATWLPAPSRRQPAARIASARRIA